MRSVQRAVWTGAASRPGRSAGRKLSLSLALGLAWAGAVRLTADSVTQLGAMAISADTIVAAGYGTLSTNPRIARRGRRVAEQLDHRPFGAD